MLSVRISSYGCTREVWRAREKRKSCLRCIREQLYLLECSPNFPSASITRYTHSLTHEIVLFFCSERNVGNFLTICFNFPFPGPFKDLRAVLVVVQYGSLMVSAISSGWSAYSENPLPLCNGHSNRIFLTNGKHPWTTMSRGIPTRPKWRSLGMIWGEQRGKEPSKAR